MPREMTDFDAMSDEEVAHRIEEWHHLEVRETEDFLRTEIVDRYPQRQKKYWTRDYTSIEAYRDSIAPNRERWRESLGEFGPKTDDYRSEEISILEDEAVEAVRLSIELFDDHHLRGRAVLGLPKDTEGPRPLVVCQHGAGSSPEKTFGFDDPRGLYHAFGRRLVENGYAVLAPRVLKGSSDGRKKFEVLCHSLGKSIHGLDSSRLEQFLDYLETREEVDTNRVAMWGLSQGGASTLFSLPYIERIDVGICGAWFNHRMKKHVIADPRNHRPRPVTDHVHFFVPNWFREFRDSDLVSLVCPRPFQVQAGRNDNISWLPYLRDEFANARSHYEKLGIGDRVELCEHEGGHEVDFDDGLRFLEEHL